MTTEAITALDAEHAGAGAVRQPQSGGVGGAERLRRLARAGRRRARGRCSRRSPTRARWRAPAAPTWKPTPRCRWALGGAETSAEVLADYEEWARRGRAALVALQAPGVATTVVPLANLGSHPLHLLANALVFDHYCHLRWDVAAPNGPIARDLPQDPAVLTETMTWMLTGLPRMCTSALAVVDRPVTLVFDGPGGGDWTLQPPSEDGALTAVVDGRDDGAAAVVRSTAHDFVCWGTKRRDWRSMGVTIDGDQGYAAQVLGAFNVI